MGDDVLSAMPPTGKRLEMNTGFFGKQRRMWLALAAVCVVLSLAAACAQLLTWRAFSTAVRTERELHATIDVLGVALKPTCVTKRAILALNKFFGPRRIIVVTTSHEACQKFTDFARNVDCLVEESLIPGVSRANVRSYLGEAYGKGDMPRYKGRDNSGWYLQQFLKLGAVEYVPDLSDFFLIWDLDMILLKPLSIFYFNETLGQQTLLNIGGNNILGYDYSYRNITGKDLRRAPDGSSFVTHWMVVHKPFMQDFLEYLSTQKPVLPQLDGPPWVWTILSSLHPDFLHLGFSEYASYNSWLLEFHPDSVFMMSTKTWRREPVGTALHIYAPMLLSGEILCCPTDKIISSMLSSNLQYLGFEIGHNVYCKYDDPKYDAGYGV